jgi:hypothetical protein
MQPYQLVAVRRFWMIALVQSLASADENVARM